MLRLRQYAVNDLDNFTALFTDADVMRYVGDGKPLKPADAQALFEKIFEIYKTDRSFFIWAIDEDDGFAGHAELKRRKGRAEYELVYIIQRERWGRSLGGKTADLLLSEARRLEIASVIATVYPENVASTAILTRRGFAHDAELSAILAAPAYRLDPSG